MDSRHRHWVLAAMLLFSALLWGCGDGPGSPGSSGSEDTGVQLYAQVYPWYQVAYFPSSVTGGAPVGYPTNNVDVIPSTCVSSDGTKSWPEYFSDHNATVVVKAELLNPKATYQPTPLTVEKYTVVFRRANDSIGSPPIEMIPDGFETFTIFPPTIMKDPNNLQEPLPVPTVTARTVRLVDLPRKAKYVSDLNTGQYQTGPGGMNNYIATFTFQGKNGLGKAFSFVAQTSFEIGPFDYCGITAPQ